MTTLRPGDDRARPPTNDHAHSVQVGGWSVVVPSIGRASLAALLASLADQEPSPAQVLVVDDRPEPASGAPSEIDLTAYPSARVVRSGGRGPAAARNAGWRATSTPWVAFLDDDVLLPPGWSRRLVSDLAGTESGTGGITGRITVPLPPDRRPTDWERNTAGLETADWATADMAYRREALEAVGGFDERFPRAYREDADLALRVRRAGWALARGSRHIIHPVRPADPWVSLRLQRGNADDALMRALHGSAWRDAAEAPPGALRRHVVAVVSGVAALAALATGRRRTATVAAGVWAGLFADFSRRRIAPGPRTAGEVRTMLVTSGAIPPAAVAWRLIGMWRHRRAAPLNGDSLIAENSLIADRCTAVIKAVLLDRDGTLVHDVPYNGDPDLVRPIDDAALALARLREAGVRLGVVTNQSGIALGRFSADDERRVAARIEDLLGPFDTWQVCPHSAADGCECRKPAPGMVLAATRALGVHPSETVMIGDIAADVLAAHAAGARAILVPTAATRAEEIAAAPEVADSLSDAVERVLSSSGSFSGSSLASGPAVRGVP